MPINEEHPVMNTPKGDFILWRYMNIPAFLSLLTKSSLTFVRADLFEDKYEGTLPRLMAEMIDFQISQKLNKVNQKGFDEKFSKVLDKQNKDIFLNCWCKENHEMVHMWKIYSKEHGVAIETTYEQLKKSVISDEMIYPTEIRYLDYHHDHINWQSNGLTAFTIKRKEYKSENEFRLILAFPRILEDEIMKTDIPNKENRHFERMKLYEQTPAIECAVNIKELILKIHLSPYAPDWYYSVLSDILKKFELENIEIIRSNL